MNSVVPALSLIGDVFGMQATAVNPPATADAVPVAIVSLCSWPGSRRWTCMSMRPGTTRNPRGTAMTCVSPASGRSRPVRAIRSPSRRMSHSPSTPAAGSMTRPPLSSRFIVYSAGKQVQNGHAHGHAVGDLLEDDRVGPVGHLGGDLDPAVHRAGVHDDDVGPGAPEPCLRHAEDGEVLAQRGEEAALHPFELDAEEHHDVCVLDRFVNRRGGAGASRSMPAGMSVGGPQTHTSAPSRVRSSRFDRNTRLWSRSPMMATLS